MVSYCYACTLIGIEAHIVQVETDLTPSLPSFQTVGLPDTVIRESKERVLSAIKNSGFFVPMQRITVNLAPAGLKKEGSGLDLAIALSIVISSQQMEVDKDSVENFLLVGELALDGRLRPVNGILSIASSMKQLGFNKLIVPEVNAKEAALVPDIEIYPAICLKDIVNFFCGNYIIKKFPTEQNSTTTFSNSYQIDFSDVKGQEGVKRALEIAAAGGHNIIMIGAPGSGKTMLARRLPTILPQMTIEEAIEATKIHSAAGILPYDQPIINERPFRSPHHTISDAGLIGGGAIPKPGEVSLAHNGVLFLDEIPEFRRNVLEVLRQPLEDFIVTISRASVTISYPARFVLAAAMNPCPCGYLTDPGKECTCLPAQILKYRNKISGPLLDRIDLHIEVMPASFNKIISKKSEETSENIRKRIEKARAIQIDRFKNEKNIFFNAHMNNQLLEKYSGVTNPSKQILKTAMEKLKLSARAYHKILKVSRTIADLETSEKIQTSHISEAIQYRTLDRNIYQ